MGDVLVGELKRQHASTLLLSAFFTREEFTLWAFWFSLGSEQEMSPAREEVIETVSDYKTSKYWVECRPLHRAGVTGILWEKANEYVNNQTPFELFYYTHRPTLPLVWENLTRLWSEMFIVWNWDQCMLNKLSWYALPSFCSVTLLPFLHLSQDLRDTTVRIMWMTVLVTSALMEEYVLMESIHIIASVHQNGQVQLL